MFDRVADLRKVFSRAEDRLDSGLLTLLFVDEVYWFKKPQQDGFLLRVEGGTVTLIDATTENPSCALTGALLTRAQVLAFSASMAPLPRSASTWLAFA